MTKLEELEEKLTSARAEALEETSYPLRAVYRKAGEAAHALSYNDHLIAVERPKEK